MKIQCFKCQGNLEKETPCEVCGYNFCSSHYIIEEEMIVCDYCSGKDMSFFDRDLEDFKGTGG